MFRKLIVDQRIRTGRYIPVEGGVNAFLDTKRDGVLVKGYHEKPISVLSKPMNINGETKRLELQLGNGPLIVKEIEV